MRRVKRAGHPLCGYAETWPTPVRVVAVSSAITRLPGNRTVVAGHADLGVVGGRSSPGAPRGCEAEQGGRGQHRDAGHGRPTDACVMLNPGGMRVVVVVAGVVVDGVRRYPPNGTEAPGKFVDLPLSRLRAGADERIGMLDRNGDEHRHRRRPWAQ